MIYLLYVASARNLKVRQRLINGNHKVLEALGRTPHSWIMNIETRIRITAPAPTQTAQIILFMPFK